MRSLESKFALSDIFSAAGLPDDLMGLDVIEREQTELRITTDSRRYGKLMTLVHGLDDKVEGKKVLSKLKSKCACGGALKDGVIELQGSHVKKVAELLNAEGYMVRSD